MKHHLLMFARLLVLMAAADSVAPPPPPASASNWNRFFPAYVSFAISSLTCIAAVIVQQVATRMDVAREESIGNGA